MITNQNIDHGKAFDWGKTSADYAKFRDIYPNTFYKKIIELGLCLKGQRVLDLGTGTGVLPRNLYKYGAEFVGSDISAEQIKQAQRLSAEANMNIQYVVSSAETVDFPGGYFDTITACQCFVYFDKSVIGAKLHSLLKDDGHFCKLSMIWLPDESEIATNSEKLVLKYNPYWTGAGFKRSGFDVDNFDCLSGYLEVTDTVSYDLNLTFTRASWHGRMKACRGIGASALSAEEIAQWEQEHMEYLQGVPESFDIPHFVSMVKFRKI